MGQKKPIAQASRTLLPAEKHYSQIEKEALGIIFAVTKFHRYLYGRFFTLQTDHKPLITIFGSKKGLPIYTANRLLRWGTILRFWTNTILRTDCEIKNMIANTIKELPVTLLEIKSEAMNDDFITNIKQKITAKNKIVPEVFSLCDNVLLYSERVVILKKLQNRILRDFHTGHPGINRMKSLMRSYVYWPKMDNDITDMIEKCKGCALAAKAPPISFKPWPKTEQPWSRIHVDFAGPLEDFYYLIVEDSYSKWPEVLRCRRPTMGTTMGFLQELFAQFGVVDCVVSDNRSQFTSVKFKEFCEIFQIKHITTPQYHPRSNGQAERFVDTLKRALKKASCTQTDKARQQFLQVYRITPTLNTPLTVSPAETMFARKIRSVFDMLLPKQNKLQKTTLAP